MKIIDTLRTVLGLRSQQQPHPLQQHLDRLDHDATVYDGAHRLRFPVVPNPEPVQPPTPVLPTPNPDPVQPPTPILPNPLPEPLQPPTPIAPNPAPAPTPPVAPRPPMVCDGLSRHAPQRPA